MTETKTSRENSNSMSEPSIDSKDDKSTVSPMPNESATWDLIEQWDLIDVENDTYDVLCSICETVLGTHTHENPAIIIETVDAGTLVVLGESAFKNCVMSAIPHPNNPDKKPFTCIQGHKIGSVTQNRDMKKSLPFLTQRRVILRKPITIKETEASALYVSLWSVLTKKPLSACLRFIAGDCTYGDSCKRLHASNEIMTKCKTDVKQRPKRLVKKPFQKSVADEENNWREAVAIKEGPSETNGTTSSNSSQTGDRSDNRWQLGSWGSNASSRLVNVSAPASSDDDDTNSEPYVTVVAPNTADVNSNAKDSGRDTTSVSTSSDNAWRPTSRNPADVTPAVGKTDAQNRHQ